MIDVLPSWKDVEELPKDHQGTDLNDEKPDCSSATYARNDQKSATPCHVWVGHGGCREMNKSKIRQYRFK